MPAACCVAATAAVTVIVVPVTGVPVTDNPLSAKVTSAPAPFFHLEDVASYVNTSSVVPVYVPLTVALLVFVPPIVAVAAVPA